MPIAIQDKKANILLSNGYNHGYSITMVIKTYLIEF